ncbi:MAG: aromatic ring-hydroxylating dioxygenase subunit alpha [Dehalococcoidia bacterium]|nr:aromatic ring-hydroxylating dioxygenase subunit alpha [Dehalococcoidia bacterium]
MTTDTTYHQMVDNKNGRMNRKIIVNEEIYKQELEQIFGRCWLWVGHEGQIPKNNDFTSIYMGEDPVLVTRDSKGKVHVFLNMCRHRGNRICRADAGNAPSFMCTYHGWTFATDGKLVGVPGYKEAYFEELDRSQWGLVEARVDTYKGLIFATWDNSAPSLLDYLGNMAWHMDLSFDRTAGGVDLLPGAHKWMMEMNWKWPTDNHVGDGYHVPITHGSIRGRGTASGTASGGGLNPANAQVQQRDAFAFGNGHGVASISPSRGSVWSADSENPVNKFNKEHEAEIKERLGERAKWQPGTCAIFPNLVISNPSWSGSIKLFLPRGPLWTLGWSYYFVDKQSPKEYRDTIRTYQTLMHGPSGIMEQDDAVPFIQATGTARGLIAQKYMINQQLGLGHERAHEEIPAMAAPSPSEIGQRGYYGFWAEMMDAPSWNQVKLTPRKF